MTAKKSAAIKILVTVFCVAFPAIHPLTSAAACTQIAHAGAGYSAVSQVKNIPVIAAASRRINAWVARTTPRRPTAIAAVRG